MEDIRQRIIAIVQGILEVPLIKFVIGHWSLSFLIFSLALTGLAARMSLVSVILHLANAALLYYGMRHQIRHSPDGTIPSCVFLVSLIITAVETNPESSISLILALIGIGFLFLMWLAAAWERPAVMKAKTAVKVKA